MKMLNTIRAKSNTFAAAKLQEGQLAKNRRLCEYVINKLNITASSSGHE